MVSKLSRSCVALGVLLGVGLLTGGPASGLVAAHPGGEEERLLGKGDRSDARFGGFPSSNVTMLSHIPIAAFGLGGTDANDCWGYVTPQGREIAIIGLQNGTGFVDITVPASPQIIGAFSGPSSIWRDIKVIGTMAYVVTEGGNHIQKFSLANADNGVIGNLGYSTYSGSGSTHNIAANPQSGYLYRTGGGNNLGIRVYGVGVNGAPGSPNSPSQRAVQNNLYVHDAQVVTYSSGPYAGREIAFLCSGFGSGSSDTRLRIWDVTSKTNMFEISSAFHPGRKYIHQGWLSEDRKYFYVNDELDDTRTSTTTLHIYNVEDLANPFYVKGWTNGNSARDHNLYVKGDLIFASNYRSGLRIFSIADPENPIEVGWIDTYPADDLNGFDGSWSNYPYFPSGTVIVSDIQQGLVVVRPELETLIFTVNQPLGGILPPEGGQELLATITELGVTLDPQSVMLSVRDSEGTVTTSPGVATGQIGQFSFVTPELACFDSVDLWLSASTTTGQTVTWPDLAPSETASATVATSSTLIFNDNAETDPGYFDFTTATNGQWTRGVPVNSDRGDPVVDADGSGRAWVTGNEAGDSDVDDGFTILYTPYFDASTGGTLTYSYWLNDTATSPLGAGDSLMVEYSTDITSQIWVPLRTYTAAFNDWRDEAIQIGSSGEIPAASAIRLRFTATDATPGNIVEAGLDSLRVEKFDCVTPVACPPDTNGDGTLSPADFSAWIAAFNAGAPECDQNADSVCTPADFSAWIANYNAGCN